MKESDMVQNNASVEESTEDKPVIYFNNAGMARFSPKVRQAAMQCIEDQLSSHEDAAGRVREHFAKLIGADADRIALMASTAFAITLAANNLKGSLLSQPEPGTILLIQDQFASAVYPWQTLCEESDGHISLEILPDPERGDTWTNLIMQRLKDEKNRIRVACLPPLHWADGHLIDLEQISAMCRQNQIPLIVDATQAVGAVPVSIAALQPAMLVCSVHKWLRGCAGYSLAYIAPEYQKIWKPLDQHARGRNTTHSDRMGPSGYSGVFFTDARKFDCGGKPNPLLLPMLKASLDEVVALDIDELQATLKRLLTPLLDRAVSSRKFVLPVYHAYHLVGLKPEPPMSNEQMTMIANKLLQENSIHIAARSGVFRISPYLDTRAGEVAVLADALFEACGVYR